VGNGSRSVVPSLALMQLEGNFALRDLEQLVSFSEVLAEDYVEA
jgi:hypothetical protein